MARVGGSYESVVRGVSEQAPQDRRSGQMWEQVNMISDPVRGLSRRHGSQYMNSTLLPIQATEVELMIDSEQMKVKEFSVNAKDYDLIYSRVKLKKLAPLYVYSKDDNLWIQTQGSGAIWQAILDNGIASMVNIGRFMYIAAKGYTPTFDTVTEVEADDVAKRITIWIRNGDYSRKYSFQYTMVDGTQHTATVETPSSSYPGNLDTSRVPVPTINMEGSPNADEISRRLAVFNQQMANYNKQVADITNEYNSNVTQWVGTSSAAIQPPAIAEKLAAEINTQLGLTDVVAADNQYIFIPASANVQAGQVVDGGDGTFMRAVVLSTDDPVNLTPICYYNKIVKVKPKSAGGRDTYYVRAEPKNTGDGRIWGEVTWREYTGIKTVPKTAFAVATIVNDIFYVASSPEELDTVLGVADTPKFQASSVGDQISSPVPAFLKRPINYLGTFQDRLLVGTGSTIFASRPGDYLNWFRQSVLTVADNDPVEMYALGSEDDIIYWDTSFDRNHIMFGRKYQYLIPGRALLTPKNPTIQIMSRIEDAVEAEPQASGNFVFYAKDTTAKGSLHQIQIGATSDSSESYECSQQLDKYIRGKPTQIMCMTAPFNILMRTRGYQNGFYIYTYLDSMQGGERLFDGWARWEWDERLGACVGINKHQGDVLCYTVRHAGDEVWLVADKFSFETDIPDVPQLDSWRSAAVWDNSRLWWHDGMQDCSAMAYRNTHDYYLLGSPLIGLDNNIPDWRDDIDHLVVGVNFPAYVVPTSPYLRDRNDKAIINGRLTLGSMTVAVSNTGGLTAELITPDRTTKMASFDGRILSRQGNRVGRAPVNDTTVIVPVYKEIREFKLVLSAITWLPLTITGMEWLGQWFSSVRRV